MRNQCGEGWGRGVNERRGGDEESMRVKGGHEKSMRRTGGDKVSMRWRVGTRSQ